MQNHDELSSLSVIFQEGSGLLFKPSSNSSNAYFMTAHHNYANPPSTGDTVIEESIIKTLKQGDLDLKHYEYECIYSSRQERNDLVIIYIKDFPTEPLEFIDIFHGYFSESFVIGYPKEKRDTEFPFQSFKSGERRGSNRQAIEKYTYEVNTQDNLHTNDSSDIDSVKGMSGGAVTVLGADGHYHLAGIIRSSSKFGNFVYTDISSLLEKINTKSTTEKAQGYKNQVFIECSIDPDQLDLQKIKKSIIESNSDIFSKYTEYNSNLEFITYEDKQVKKEFSKYRETRNKVSDYYIFSGIVHHENGDHGKSTIAFKKAIELNGGNQHIFNKTYMDRRALQLNEKTLKANIKALRQESEKSEHEVKYRLCNILIYHKGKDLEIESYFKEMNELDRRELAGQCKQYLAFDEMDFYFEASYFLSVIYFNFGMYSEAREKCQEVFKIFKLYPNKEHTIYAIRCNTMQSINFSADINFIDLKRGYNMARHGTIDEKSTKILLENILKVIEALFHNLYEKGSAEEDGINKMYYPLLELVEKIPNGINYKDEIESCRRRMLSRLNGKYSKISKDDAIGKIKLLEEQLVIANQKLEETPTHPNNFLATNIAKILDRIMGLFGSKKDNQV